ncbi:MAG TPA: hypothetical protein VEC12_01590, partial [Bacteroidia bacterium]|nr:hypothetical protein [Bacteroidia bacterium]
MKLLFNILLVLLPFALTAQYTEDFYESGQLKSKGTYKSWKIKSTYGHDITKVKNGKWEYFYETGDPALVEFHKARKSGAKAKGTWEYYSTNGELLKKEYYSNGNLSKTEFFTEGLFNFLTDSFTLTRISADSMRLTNYLHGTPFRQIVVNNGKGVFVYPKAAPNSDKYEIAALADDGFSLKDTGRNLVGNYSFENSKFKKYYSDDISEITGVADTFAYHWYIATGTPDYFRHQSSARTGDKFLGIRIYSNSEYLEYAENQ